jgi:hypothetical protein
MWLYKVGYGYKQIKPVLLCKTLRKVERITGTVCWVLYRASWVHFWSFNVCCVIIVFTSNRIKTQRCFPLPLFWDRVLPFTVCYVACCTQCLVRIKPGPLVQRILLHYLGWWGASWVCCWLSNWVMAKVVFSVALSLVGGEGGVQVPVKRRFYLVWCNNILWTNGPDLIPTRHRVQHAT